MPSVVKKSSLYFLCSDTFVVLVEEYILYCLICTLFCDIVLHTICWRIISSVTTISFSLPSPMKHWKIVAFVCSNFPRLHGYYRSPFCWKERCTHISTLGFLYRTWIFQLVYTYFISTVQENMRKDIVPCIYTLCICHVISEKLQSGRGDIAQFSLRHYHWVTSRSNDSLCYMNQQISYNIVPFSCNKIWEIFNFQQVLGSAMNTIRINFHLSYV